MAPPVRLWRGFWHTSNRFPATGGSQFTATANWGRHHGRVALLRDRRFGRNKLRPSRMGSRHLGGGGASRPRRAAWGGSQFTATAFPHRHPSNREGRVPARPLTGKAAFQAAHSRRAPIENWQHFPLLPTAGILVYLKPLRGGIRQAGAANFAALSPLLSGRTTSRSELIRSVNG